MSQVMWSSHTSHSLLYINSGHCWHNITALNQLLLSSPLCTPPNRWVGVAVPLHRVEYCFNKVFHQVQLLHRASLESSWVMKYKTWVAPKNHFIFNVMIPPLNRVSHSSCYRTRLTHLQWSLHGHMINLQNVMHQSLKATYNMPGWGTWPFRLWHWRSPGALLCCKHAARGLFSLHLTCRGQEFWSDLCDRSAFWLPQDPAWSCLPPCRTYRQGDSIQLLLTARFVGIWSTLPRVPEG